MKAKKLLLPILSLLIAVSVCCLVCACSNQAGKYDPVYKYTTEDGKEVYDWPAGAETGMIEVDGGKVPYWLYGKDKPGTPIVCVHGGPGGNCTGFFRQVCFSEDRPFLVYNQLGSVKTEVNDEYMTPDKIKSLYTIERYAKELDTVIKHFNFDSYILYGASWGCMLSLEYAAKYQSPALRGIVFDGPFLDVDTWINDAQRLLLSLDDGQHKLDVVKQCESTGVYTKEFDEINDVFSATFNNRHKGQIKDRVNKDNTEHGYPNFCGIDPYEYMWGKSEFSCTGTLQHHSSLPLLKIVNVPMLYVSGQYDEGTPEAALYYSSLSYQGEVAVLPSSAHCANFERPEEFNVIFEQFVKRIETGEK